MYDYQGCQEVIVSRLPAYTTIPDSIQSSSLQPSDCNSPYEDHYHWIITQLLVDKCPSV